MSRKQKNASRRKIENGKSQNPRCAQKTSYEMTRLTLATLLTGLLLIASVVAAVSPTSVKISSPQTFSHSEG